MVKRGVAAAFVVLLTVGCSAESSSNAEINTKERVVSADFVNRAEEVIAQADPPEDGWVLGVVASEDTQGRDWTLALVNEAGGTTITESRDCDGDDWDKRDDLLILLDPGDLIAWSTAGEDNRVCSYEVNLIRKAAAL